MSESALSFDGVSKKFRRGQLHDSLRDLIPALARRLTGRGVAGELGKQEFWALRDVSFEVGRGEAFGIIGYNGAGKSTALKLLSGILVPTRGSIHVRGRLSALIEVGAGFHPDLTGRENVYLNGTILGMRRAEIARKFDEIVAFSGLEEFIDTPVKRYSSGMFARLGFSVAAHLEPDILIIDEVLSVGDYRFQQKGVEKMKSIARGGTTVVFVSHNLRAVGHLCQRCLLLAGGRVFAMGRTSDVLLAYLGVGASREENASPTGVRVSGVSVRGQRGREIRFESGDRAWVDVDVTAYQRVGGLTIALGMFDEAHNEIFSTGTSRLGLPLCSVEEGDRMRVTFELDLHCAAGTYHFGALVHSHETQHTFDRWDAAATVFITADPAVDGVVNLRPRAAIGRLPASADRDRVEAEVP